MTLKDYPLRANYSGPCQFDSTKERVQVKGYLNVTHDEDIIKDALYETGPLSILLDFTGMMHYKSGIANPLLCADWPDHALVLVGFWLCGDQEGGRVLANQEHVGDPSGEKMATSSSSGIPTSVGIQKWGHNCPFLNDLEQNIII